MRSKTISNTALTSLFILLVVQYSSAASAILGIDIGQEFIKAALVKPGIPLEIVLTKDTKRKEASAIGFKPANTPAKEGEFTFPERLYGADAINLAGRFPHDVYPNLKQLLGKLAVDDAVATYSGRQPALEILPSLEQDTVAFKSKSSPKNGIFTVEELLAMQLKAIVAQTQAMAGVGAAPIKDIVFTVPTFFLAEEKYALTLAAELAKLNVMGFVSDGLAVGLNYATSRTFDEKNPEYHIVYDMGAGSTTASVLRFQGKTVKDGRFKKTVQEVSVMGVGFDRTLGGDLFNEEMVGLLAADFVGSKKGQKALASTQDPNRALRLNGRAAAKLWREATRSRQILSANTETISSVESLYEDVDFRSGKLTRAQFEDAIKVYEPRITKPILDALDRAGISLDQVNTIILHGGAVRTPFVGKKLEEIVGGHERISKNVNPDEAAVFGATFKGAGESGSFKVKEIETYDINPYGVSVNYLKSAKAAKETKQNVFAPGSVIGKEKNVQFPHKQDFEFEVVHNLPPRPNDPKQLPGLEMLWDVKSTNVTESIKKLQDDFKCTEMAISTHFAITIGKKDGIPIVSKGWVECEVEVPEEKRGIVDGVKKAFGFGKDKDSSSSSSSSSSTATASSSTSTTATGTASAAPEATPKLVKKTQRIPVAFTASKAGIPFLSTAAKTALKGEIASFDTHDKTRRTIEEARNELEAFTYKTRELLYNDAFILSSTEEVRRKLTAILDEAGDWLYGDGAQAALSDVRAKLKSLKDIEAPISARKNEHEVRPSLIKLMRQSIDQGRVLIGALQNVPTEDESLKYTDEEVAELTKLHDETEAWLNEMEKKQEALAGHEEPVLTAKELRVRTEKLEKAVMEAVRAKSRAAEELKRKKAKEERERKKREKEEEEKKKKEAEEKKAEEKKAEEKAETVTEKEKTEAVTDKPKINKDEL